MVTPRVTEFLPARSFRYVASGICFASELECPEVPASSGPPVVVMRLGHVPERLRPERIPEGSFAEAEAGRFLLSIKGVARYLVAQGREVTIEPSPQAIESEVRLCLLGAVMGALVHQRGGLALHAGAIATPKGAVLLGGGSGAGKSTLLAAFLSRGYSLLADDMATILSDDAGRLHVYPAYPQLKLWPDALQLLGWSDLPLNLLSPNHEKVAVGMQDRFMANPQPLRHVYRLVPGDRPEVVLAPALGGARLESLLNMSYGGRYIDAMGLRESHFSLTAAVAASVPVTDVWRPDELSLLPELVEGIERDLGL